MPCLPKAFGRADVSRVGKAHQNCAGAIGRRNDLKTKMPRALYERVAMLWVGICPQPSEHAGSISPYEFLFLCSSLPATYPPAKFLWCEAAQGCMLPACISKDRILHYYT